MFSSILLTISPWKRKKNIMKETFLLELAWRLSCVWDTWASTSMARYWNMSCRSRMLRSSFRISSCRDSISFRACFVAFASLKICEPQKWEINTGKNGAGVFGLEEGCTKRGSSRDNYTDTKVHFLTKSAVQLEQSRGDNRANRSWHAFEWWKTTAAFPGRQLSLLYSHSAWKRPSGLLQASFPALRLSRLCRLGIESAYQSIKAKSSQVRRPPWMQRSSLILSCLCILSTLRSLYCAWMVLQ